MPSTGVPILDSVLGGGYLDRSAVLIEGLSGNEKENLGYEFVRSGLDQGDFCLYITRLSSADVLSDASASGIDLAKGTFWMCPENGDRSYVPEDLAGISFRIKSVLKEHEGAKARVVFDLSSQLLMGNPSESVFRFLGQLIADLKKYNVTFVATVQEDIHPPQVLAGLELLFDGVLSVRKADHAKSEIKIRKMRGVKPAETSALIPAGAAPKEEPSSNSGTRRVAVLPFVNMSPDPNDEYFADGLTEELIDRLCQVRELEVIARTSVMAYKNKEKKAAEIGNELRVGALVEGSVRKAGNKIRVTAQLIDVLSEAHLWSSRYDSELQDIFTVQTDIAEKITESLKLNLIDTEKERIGRRATSVPEAYVAYLNGVYFRYKATMAGVKKAIDYNTRAVELDSDYAEAFAQLAINYCFMGVFWGEPVDRAFTNARASASKALELNPNLAEAHYARSWVSYFYETDWGGAEREGRKAAELKPSYAEPRISLAYIYLALGRKEEAQVEARKAVDLDPMGVYSHLVLARVLATTGAFDEAILCHGKAIEIEPNAAFLHSELGFTYLEMGETAEGVREMVKARELPDGEFFKAGLGYAYAVSGMEADATKIAAELTLAREKGRAGPYEIAMIYAGLGETSKAIDMLNQAYQERSIVRLLLFAADPAFATLRNEPGFKALLRKLNLGEDSGSNLSGGKAQMA